MDSRGASAPPPRAKIQSGKCGSSLHYKTGQMGLFSVKLMSMVLSESFADAAEG